jgi:flavin-dependent dehydrogenase
MASIVVPTSAFSWPDRTQNPIAAGLVLTQGSTSFLFIFIALRAFGSPQFVLRRLSRPSAGSRMVGYVVLSGAIPNGGPAITSATDGNAVLIGAEGRQVISSSVVTGILLALRRARLAPGASLLESAAVPTCPSIFD